MLILCAGIAISSWGISDIQCEGPDIKNIIIVLVGIGITGFSFLSMAKAGEYYQEKESPKTEIITTTPAQIDTIITIKNRVPDTTFVYNFTFDKE